MDNDINEIEEIELDMHTLNLINHLSEIEDYTLACTLTDDSHYFSDLYDLYYEKETFLRGVLGEKSWKLSYRIKNKLKELFKINNIKLTILLYDNQLYEVNNYDKGYAELTGRTYIFGEDLIVFESKDGFVYPLFKIKPLKTKAVVLER